MPSSWFSNDDDYVDSYYTLEKDRGYVNHVGAADDATVTLSPYQLVEQRGLAPTRPLGTECRDRGTA